MKRIATPIETTEICSYGCGLVARFINKSKKLMCDTSSNKCPAVKQRNSNGLKNCGRDYVETYKNIPQESKDRMNWARGLTKEIDERVARPQFIGKRWGCSRYGHTDETIKKISEARTEWLKNSDNRKNLGRHKKSWMEETFESYLNDNRITDWETEVHFWSESLRKNFYPDFLFRSKYLIIELDGTQHRKSIEHDKIRDKWFAEQGYKVVRIDVDEFKRRHFSGEGFLDLLPT